ncbi:hypothetical protein AB0F96_05660 [Streptomyces sp. NPDC023998]|uniref:hypothetical protein n=1 Tax=Streptomyces sp. NPDC023998 TaxID=3154597 RepID=UPI0033D3554D
MEIELLDTIVAVYPGGALLKVFVDAPALEFAEEAVQSVVEDVLERSELLSEWIVEQREVQLHPEFAKESLEAADGPDVPPDDPAARLARHIQPASDENPASGTDQKTERVAAQATIRSMAGELRAFVSGSFGVLDEEDRKEDGDSEFSTLPEDAELAAGALMYGTHLLVEELFQDVHTLTREGTNVAQCERPMWLLDELPSSTPSSTTPTSRAASWSPRSP